MDYRFKLKESNENAQEQYELSILRIQEMISSDEIALTELPESLKEYFTFVGHFLLQCASLYKSVQCGEFREWSLQKLQEENHHYYEDILPENYEKSYANPAYAVNTLGEEYGRIFSFIYTELRTIREYIFEQNIEKIAMLMELFLEVYFLFEHETVTYKQLRETVYSYMYDYAEEWISWRVRQKLDPDLDYAVSIIEEEDLDQIRYLYYYGEYISEDEIELVRFFSQMDEEKVNQVADSFLEAFLRSARLKEIDLTCKDTVEIKYHLGYEKVIRKAVASLNQMGLRPIIYPTTNNSMNKYRDFRIGYHSNNPNRQYSYDHRFDDAIYFDKRMVDRKISCLRRAYETYEDLASGYAGTITVQVFGVNSLQPVLKSESYHLSERQEGLKGEYLSRYYGVRNEYINPEQNTYTVISYPVPSIGDAFAGIFDDILKLNTEDSSPYQAIQQRLISVLNTAQYIKIMGRKRNMTNITIQLQDLNDPETETKFESCMDDRNVPQGEVVTTPKLKKTEGLFHATNIYINGLNFKDLRLTFEDGYITEYSCGNYENPEEGRRYFRENILLNRETLPIGVFSIGTNTAAYVMASRYGIVDKLPVLILEKMGSHLTLGDPAYSYAEDEIVKNPDGKIMIAKENEQSANRLTNRRTAYHNVRVDLGIPYEDIGRVVAVTADRIEIPIILEGRFVLDGTLELNKPFQQS